MALPATDAFTGAGPLALSASWTQITDEGLPLVHNDVAEVTAVGSDAGAYWNADAFNTNHYSQIKAIAAVSAGAHFISAAVRVQVGARQYYRGGCFGALGGSVSYEIGKRNGGTNTVLKSGTATINVNDVLRLEVSGTTLTLKNITTATTIDTISDPGGFTGGAAGIFLFADSGSQANATLDDWEGGDVSAGGLTAAQMAGIFAAELSGCVIGRVDA